MYFPPRFDRKRAIELLELVIKAYNQFEAYKDKKNWIAPVGYTMIKELYYTESRTGVLLKESSLFERELKELIPSLDKMVKSLPIGFILQSKNDLYIILRGTMTATEWLHNLNMGLKAYLKPEFGKVHEGFLQMYNVVRKDIKQTLAGLDSIKRIFIAGHSLGGALATLLIPDFESKLAFKSLSVYTYGSPRVGDNKFAESYNQRFGSNTFRITNTSDLVTSVPFPAPFIGFLGGYFSHVETPVDFTIQNNDLEKNHKPETYLTVLKEAREPWGFFRRFFR